MWEVSRGTVKEHDLDPRELGIPRASIDDLVGGDAAHNAAIVHEVFAGERGAVRDIVVLNAAAGLVAFELAKDPSQFQRAVLDRFRDKMAVAEEAIDSGAAARKLDQWISATKA